MSGTALTGVLIEIGIGDDGQNFVRIEREIGATVITGLTDDEIRALAPHFFSIVYVTIGGAA